MQPQKTTSWGIVLVIIIIAAILGWYVIYLSRGLVIEYDKIDALDSKTTYTNMTKIDLPHIAAPLVMPSLEVLADNNVWMYVSNRRPLAPTYTPKNLSDVDLPHGDSSIPKLSAQVIDPLKRLFQRADADGVSLMISSAYRSISDQQNLYDSFVAKRGQTVADQYVAKPGTSEHHTGYAVDITDASAACEQNSDACNLSPSSAQWLAGNAPEYGFIIRYPSGKQPFTGTPYEPWHLRYVGVATAGKLTEAELTLDEFIEQIAPGRLVQE